MHKPSRELLQKLHDATRKEYFPGEMAVELMEWIANDAGKLLVVLEYVHCRAKQQEIDLIRSKLENHLDLIEGRLAEVWR